MSNNIEFLKMFSLFVYNSILLSPLALLLFKSKRFNKISWLIVSCILTYVIFIVAIRYNVGRDFSEYAYMYDHIDLASRLEIGFLSLMQILNYFNLDSQFLFFSAAILIYPVIFYSYSRYKSVVFILVWMLVNFLPSLNQIRQYVCMAILTWAVFYLLDKRKIKYLITIVVATSFHIVGVFGFMFLLMSKIKIKWLHIISLFAPLLIFVSISDLLLTSGIFSGSYYEYYLLDKEIYAGQQTFSIGGAIRLIVPYVFLFKYRRMNSPYFNLVSNAMFAYVVLYFLSLNFYILYRIYTLFLLLLPFATFSLMKETRLIKAVVVVYVLALFIFAQKSILQQTIDPPVGNSVYPYQTIFTNNPVEQYLR